MKAITKGLCIALGMLLVCATALPVFAGSVSYEGQAKGFVFSTGSEENPTDLFAGFKDVMPGDQLSDTIDIQNVSKKNVVIYLRAEAPTQNVDFLKQLTLTVTDEDGDEIFAAAADETTGLEDWHPIGSFAPNTKMTLNLQLKVPETMGNEFQDAAGDVNWSFKVEEEDDADPKNPSNPKKPSNPKNPSNPKKPSNPKNPSNPKKPSNPVKKPKTSKKSSGNTTSGTSKSAGKAVKTGDESNVLLWGALMGIAALTGVAVLRRKKG